MSDSILDASTLALLMEKAVPAAAAIAPERYAAAGWLRLETGDPRLAAMGIEVEQGVCAIMVRRTDVRLGRIRIARGAPGSLLVFDNQDWAGTLNMRVRFAGEHSKAIFNLAGRGEINITNLFLRSTNALFYWGAGSTAVEMRVEIEGRDRCVIVGDDALISTGVWIRNFEMHAIVDLETGETQNQPTDTVLEKHVWLGQEALLLSCPSVGLGSIIGARSLVKNAVPRRVAMGGVPAKILRRNVSWGRGLTGLMPGESRLLQSEP